MYIGADYYPEHRDRALWETDARLMQDAGFNVVRMAEFAWVFFEPEEGRFEFGWLDESLDILNRHGISAVLGTPTAVMPAWLARKYPETLAADKTGRRVTWGVRKNNCFTAGAYRLLSERITRAMAEHYQAAPNVIGWQTDNEFGGPVCFCDTCKASFHDWLRSRYKTLDELNRAWGTCFWGHRFGEWAEIPLPDDPSTHNPGLCLDWRRFNSWLNVRFQADQVRILRQVCPQHFVTHNFMGLYSELDYYDLARDLDFVSWDNYPVWGPPEFHYDAATAADLMRGLKRRNFWIMEQTAGTGGWGAFGRNPRPGELRQIAYQQLAHGADAQVWFRWDTCNSGREQYWHGLLGHDSKPGRRYAEAAQTAREYHRLAPELDGTTVKTPVAMVYDYDSIWAFQIQPAYGGGAWEPLNGAANYHNAVRRYYRALLRAGVNVDMIRPGEDLSAYRVVFAPHLYVLPDRVAQQLSAFVQDGGILVSDCRTGVKDETSLCYSRTLPGLLADPLGIAIDEYESLSGGITYAVTGFGASYTAVQYADWVRPASAETLAGYEPWHMRPYAALTRNRYGKGLGYYAGAILAEDGFYDALVAEVLQQAGVAPAVKPPAGVEASVREGGGRKLLFLVNHTEQTQTVGVPPGNLDLLSGQTTGATIDLDGYGVAVVKLA